jgi:hypothetical protein
MTELDGLAQRLHGQTETLHVVVYFAEEPQVAYEEIGLARRGREGYLVSRSAAMGAVAAEVTTATFYVFAPGLVQRSLPAAWAKVSPAQALVARHRGVSAALHRVLGDVDVSEALDLAWEACTALTAPARPMYAALSGLPWPSDPLVALWHAASLLREYRGDGHFAQTMLLQLDPVESMVIHGIHSGSTDFLRATRGWSAEEWEAGQRRLVRRGLVKPEFDALTDAGAALKADLEQRTLAAAMAPWTHLGPERSAQLARALSPVRRALIDSDIFPAGSPLKPRG